MLRKAALNLFLTAMFGIAGVMLVPAAFGLHRYVILTGSMTGTYDPGSIVFDKQVATSSLEVGDAITYAPPPGMSPNHDLVTHRIVRIGAGRGGHRVYQTKGDANKTADRWRFMLPASEQDKVVFHLPYAGYIFAVLGVPQARMALIGLPALLVALWIVIGMWRDAGEIVRRRERGVAWSTVSVSRTPNLGPASPGARAGSGSGAVALPITWGLPAPRRHGPAPTPEPACTPQRGRVGRVPLPVTCEPRGRPGRVEVPIILPARLTPSAHRPESEILAVPD
ncbi:MAG TPA: signal peptidase I [Thermoleophilaceae bacterium]|nr:signal peptidase I [Thermoleophilaceae bacterium]